MTRLAEMARSAKKRLEVSPAVTGCRYGVKLRGVAGAAARGVPIATGGGACAPETSEMAEKETCA